MHPAITKAIATGSVLQMVEQRDKLALVQSVNFDRETNDSKTPDPYGKVYNLEILPKIFPETKKELICFFPMHPKPEKQVLTVGSYFGFSLDSLNQTLNRRLTESKDDWELTKNARFAIAFKEQVYVFTNLSGTIYIFWANIKIDNCGSVPSQYMAHWPVVFNLNGEGCVKNIFILKRKLQSLNTRYELRPLPILPANPTLITPEVPIFVCENCPTRPAGSGPGGTTSHISREAIRMKMLPHGTRIPIDYIDNPFETVKNDGSINMEASSMEEDDISWTQQTPRVINGNPVAIPMMPVKEKDPFDGSDSSMMELGEGIEVCLDDL